MGSAAVIVKQQPISSAIAAVKLRPASTTAVITKQQPGYERSATQNSLSEAHYTAQVASHSSLLMPSSPIAA